MSLLSPLVAFPLGSLILWHEIAAKSSAAIGLHECPLLGVEPMPVELPHTENPNDNAE
jgi:hypothetical protein